MGLARTDRTKTEDEEDKGATVAWDFSTEPEFEEQLAWMRQFVREEIFPLETIALDHDTMSRG